MRPVLMVVDDFLPHPHVIRNEVISLGFKDEFFEGVTYHTVNADYRPPEIVRELARLYNRAVQIHVAAFRQGKKGSPLHNLVHSDNSCATFASVLYLNLLPDCVGGTAFWRHRATGWDSQPTEDQLKDAGLTIEEFGRDWHNADAWEMTSLAGMKFNRMITYPTTMFHSRWPWEGFGDTEENARLIHAMMFDLV